MNSDMIQQILWGLAGLYLAFVAKRELRKRNRQIETRWKSESEQQKETLWGP